MKKIYFLTLIITSVILSVSKQFAQSDSLSKGDLLRITSPKLFYQPAICTFDRMADDFLLVKKNNQILQIPYQQIQKIEISKFKERNTLVGAIVGSVLGGVVLGIVMEALKTSGDGWSDVGQPGFLGGFATGVLLGGGIGAFIGYNISTDKWSEISLKKKFVF